MAYTTAEVARGKQIDFTVNRLQHMTMADKLNTVTQLFDRGMMTIDEGREVFQMPILGTPEAQRYYIRREYAEVNALNRQDGVTEGSEGIAGGNQPRVPDDAAAGTGGGQ